MPKEAGQFARIPIAGGLARGPRAHVRNGTVPVRAARLGGERGGIETRRRIGGIFGLSHGRLLLVDCGQAVVRRYKHRAAAASQGLRQHVYPTRFWVLGQLIPDLQLPRSSRFTHIVSVRTIELLITEVCAKPNSVLFEDDEAG